MKYTQLIHAKELCSCSLFLQHNLGTKPSLCNEFSVACGVSWRSLIEINALSHHFCAYCAILLGGPWTQCHGVLYICKPSPKPCTVFKMVDYCETLILHLLWPILVQFWHWPSWNRSNQVCWDLYTLFWGLVKCFSQGLTSSIQHCFQFEHNSWVTTHSHMCIYSEQIQQIFWKII